MLSRIQSKSFHKPMWNKNVDEIGKTKATLILQIAESSLVVILELLLFAEKRERSMVWKIVLVVYGVFSVGLKKSELKLLNFSFLIISRKRVFSMKLKFKKYTICTTISKMKSKAFVIVSMLGGMGIFTDDSVMIKRRGLISSSFFGLANEVLRYDKIVSEFSTITYILFEKS